MLPINITELLEQNCIESSRIEYKKGRNPTAIYHTNCAFANDFENLGGGYIVVGVETDNETGKVIRPIFLIDIPCHPEFLKEEEVVTTCINLVSSLDASNG